MPTYRGKRSGLAGPADKGGCSGLRLAYQASPVVWIGVERSPEAGTAMGPFLAPRA